MTGAPRSRSHEVRSRLGSRNKKENAGMYMGFDAVASAADVAGTTEETALGAYIADIGEMLRARRERLHLTRAELTQRAGVGLQTVIRIEAGNPGTAIVNLFKVAQSLGCDINEISGALAKAIESPLKT